eukprot:jgi/Galph1/4254/GphlegSOOS_G2942.1
MKERTLPKLPLPPPILSKTPDTWAHETITKRVPTEILPRVLRENDFFDEESISMLRFLSNCLNNAEKTVLTHVPNDGGDDLETWRAIMEKYVGKCTWLTAPWCTVEFYFYRYLMVAVHWFRDRRDPFQHQKELGIQSGFETALNLLGRLRSICKLSVSSLGDVKLQFVSFLFLSLWGNRLDLSLWPVGSSRETGKSGDSLYKFVQEATTESESLLANDSIAVSNYLYDAETRDEISSASNNRKRMDIIVDNAGLELFCDMCFAYFLIASGTTESVVFHLKKHPTFVSDAMTKDLLYVIQYIEEMTQGQPVYQLMMKEWRHFLSQGHWITREDYFWCQPFAFWEMPESLKEDLRLNSSLVFIKGDANYRRLLGDLQWEMSTSFSDIVSYFPTAVCALRILKAEILCGVSKEKQKYAYEKDKQWMVSGEWAVIQFYKATN